MIRVFEKYLPEKLSVCFKPNRLPSQQILYYKGLDGRSFASISNTVFS